MTKNDIMFSHSDSWKSLLLWLEIDSYDHSRCVHESLIGLLSNIFETAQRMLCKECGEDIMDKVSCPNCPEVSYCSKTCQQINWVSSHMEECSITYRYIDNTSRSMINSFQPIDRRNLTSKT